MTASLIVNERFGRGFLALDDGPMRTRGIRCTEGEGAGTALLCRAQCGGDGRGPSECQWRTVGREARLAEAWLMRGADKE